MWLGTCFWKMSWIKTSLGKKKKEKVRWGRMAGVSRGLLQSPFCIFKHHICRKSVYFIYLYISESNSGENKDDV